MYLADVASWSGYLFNFVLRLMHDLLGRATGVLVRMLVRKSELRE